MLNASCDEHVLSWYMASLETLGAWEALLSPIPVPDWGPASSLRVPCVLPGGAPRAVMRFLGRTPKGAYSAYSKREDRGSGEAAVSYVKSFTARARA